MISKEKKDVLNVIQPNSVVAEIGVWSGDFSIHILSKQPSKFYLVDPWKFITDDEKIMNKRRYTGGRTKNQTQMDAVYNGVVNKFGGYDNVEIVRKFSDDWFSDIENESLDFIYIDGNHSEEFVYNDIMNSYDKVKAGGIIAGDDYQWFENGEYDVQKAVAMAMVELDDKVDFFYKGTTQYMLKKIK